jgi:mannose-6-phosphate isomerase-like protein (cupin superfamily)
MQLAMQTGGESAVGDQTKYVINSHARYAGLQKFDIITLEGVCTEKWFNQTLCQVNDSVVRLGVFEGQFHWHSHEYEDEFFFVVSGRFYIDLKEEDRTIDLQPGQAIVIPKGVEHRTRAPRRTVVLMVEKDTVTPTGD